jgi:hypothetical protein
MTSPTNYDLPKVMLDLLAIVKVAMSDHLYDMDSRVHAARQMLAALRPSSHRTHSVPRADQPLTPYLGEADPSDPAAHEILAALDAMPAGEWDVAAALDVFMAEADAPATRPDAISLILRDWLVGHGYFEPLPRLKTGTRLSRWIA